MLPLQRTTQVGPQRKINAFIYFIYNPLFLKKIKGGGTKKKIKSQQ